jgi:hypothetical protein
MRENIVVKYILLIGLPEELVRNTMAEEERLWDLYQRQLHRTPEFTSVLQKLIAAVQNLLEAHRNYDRNSFDGSRAGYSISKSRSTGRNTAFSSSFQDISGWTCGAISRNSGWRTTAGSTR